MDDAVRRRAPPARGEHGRGRRRRGMAGHNTDAPGFDRFLRPRRRLRPGGQHRPDVRRGRRGARVRARARPRRRLPDHGRRPRSGRDRRTSAQRSTGSRRRSRSSRCSTTTAHPADLVVNATPLGADGEQLPMPPVDDETLVVDLLYHPAVTPMQVTARARRRHRVRRARPPAAPGGACASSSGPGSPAPLEVMSAAAVAAIAERPDRSVTAATLRTQGRSTSRRCLQRDGWTNTPRSRSASSSPWTTCGAVSCCLATAWCSAPFRRRTSRRSSRRG